MSQATPVASEATQGPPLTLSWKDLISVYTKKEDVPLFTDGQLVTYFVCRTVADGLPAGDFKSVNRSAKYLFDCGHVQNIQVGASTPHTWIKANCLPEMKKDRVYKLLLSLDSTSWDILTAECGCPAGKGPNASCKHVGALCYALVQFCKSGQLPDFLTCTQRLQEWNKPRPRKVEPIPVLELTARRKEILNSKRRLRPVPSQYDPRPLSLRSPDPLRLEKLRTDLLQLNRPCVLTQLLRAPVEVALHDHNYVVNISVCDPRVVGAVGKPKDQQVRLCPCAHNQVDKTLLKRAKGKLNVTCKERIEIEKNTQAQIQSSEWFAVRTRRITGSKSGKILCQKERTVALLTDMLYRKPLLHLPKAIAWGIKHESSACAAYLKYMQSNVHKDATTSECGFIIHPTMGWLGASPDALVTDPSSSLQSGIAEFKCPFSKKDQTLSEACSDPNFYFSFQNGSFQLKRDHCYYHQVQLQLFVGMDIYHWCDFCVYTTKGIGIERIWLDTAWCNTCIPELESYFDAYMLPEIVNPMYKPPYVL